MISVIHAQRSCIGQFKNYALKTALNKVTAWLTRQVKRSGLLCLTKREDPPYCAWCVYVCVGVREREGEMKGGDVPYVLLVG